MREFQGWTPKIVDNLTFNQLDAILIKLNKYRKDVPPLDAAFESLKLVIFKYLGVKKVNKNNNNNVGVIPSAKGTSEEIEAWANAGYPPTFEKFITELRKKKGN